jgi:hypothetical protein
LVNGLRHKGAIKMLVVSAGTSSSSLPCWRQIHTKKHPGKKRFGCSSGEAVFTPTSLCFLERNNNMELLCAVY